MRVGAGQQVVELLLEAGVGRPRWLMLAQQQLLQPGPQLRAQAGALQRLLGSQLLGSGRQTVGRLLVKRLLHRLPTLCGRALGGRRQHHSRAPGAAAGGFTHKV